MKLTEFLSEFEDSVNRTRGKVYWELTTCEQIRGFLGDGRGFCPVTFVYFLKFEGHYFEPWEADLAAYHLKLSVKAWQHLLHAVEPIESYSEELRKQLLRITSPRPTRFSKLTKKGYTVSDAIRAGGPSGKHSKR